METLYRFTDAVANRRLQEAAEIAGTLPVNLKCVAREIWSRWADDGEPVF